VAVDKLCQGRQLSAMKSKATTISEHHLLLDEQGRKQALIEIQAMIDAAINSGPAELFDMEHFIAQQKAR